MNIYEELDNTYVLEQYDEYLTQHISNVQEAYEWLCTNLPEVIDKYENQAQIQSLILSHDQSKYKQEEYFAYANNFFSKSKTKDIKDAFNVAWNHHIHNNPHHWQHWVIVEGKDNYTVLDMPYEYIIEMVCDHWSFSFKKGNLNEIFDWYEKNKKSIIFSDNTRKTYAEILNKIKEKLN